MEEVRPGAHMLGSVQLRLLFVRYPHTILSVA